MDIRRTIGFFACVALAACGGGASVGPGAAPAAVATTSGTAAGPAPGAIASASARPSGSPSAVVSPSPSAASSASPAAGAGTPSPTATAAALNGTTVTTTSGTYAGTASSGVVEFKGVPYAQPPVGTLRFEPPVPLASPAPGVTQANAFKPACYQQSGADETIAGPQNQSAESEDCLYLNVYAPAGLSGGRPVDVWIYGGAYAAGYGDPYDGSTYAKQGAVFVSFDYRLGIFGFFANPQLDATSPRHTSGNQGILDQIAVLRWVKANIAAFGGDPSRVTIHGESAGAGSVETLLGSPLASGLFSRAIAESPFIGFHPEYTTATLEQYYAANFALSNQSLATLRTVPAATLNQAQPMMTFDNSRTTPFDPDQYAPSVDGYVLPQDLRHLALAGRLNPADLIVGNCDNEGLLFTQAPYAPYSTVATFPTYVQQSYGAMAARAQALYPADSTTVGDQLGQFYADPIFNYDARELARTETMLGKRVYRYVFTRVPPGQNGPDTHICEIPFVFPGDYPPTAMQIVPDAGAAAYATMVDTALGRFMATGDPNGGLPVQWPQYDLSTESYYNFDGNGGSLGAGYRNPQLDLVAQHLQVIDP